MTQGRQFRNSILVGGHDNDGDCMNPIDDSRAALVTVRAGVRLTRADSAVPEEGKENDALHG